MRERLNNDPKVQLAVLAIAAVALGLVLMIQLGGGGSSTTTTDPNAATTTPEGTDPAATGTDPAATASATDTGATATAPPATATTPPDAATGSVTPSATAPTTTAPPAATGSAALLPTKGLPSDVLVAYAKSKPVVLLVIDPRSRTAPRLKRYAAELDGYEGAEIFVVGTKKVPRYSRITEGVQVTQTPAIVAVTPRKVNAATPTAAVSYGVRSKKSFKQAIKDATYSGQSLPAYP